MTTYPIYKIPAGLDHGTSAQDPVLCQHPEHGWIVMPSRYDPTEITHEDLVEDCALRGLTANEIREHDLGDTMTNANHRYHLIANPIKISDGIIGGRVLSSHRTLTGAARALDRAQAPTRRANPGCHLDLRVVEAIDEHHGRRLPEGQWADALLTLEADRA